MNVVILDAGNAIIKAKTATKEETFVHALRRLTETEYQDILTRSGRQGAPKDYIRVNGVPYVVGESAERHGTSDRRTGRTGASRYTADYYGVLCAAMLARLHDRSAEVALFCSHPPGDIAYRDELMYAAGGQDWEVEYTGKTLHFTVSYVNTFDEPLGGLMNVILATDGKRYERSDINGGRALVIDIGGHTTDWLAVNAGGSVDYSLNESTPLGILGVLRDFERSFKDSHKEVVKAATKLPEDRIRRGLRDRSVKLAGRDYPCEAEATEAMSVLINRILDTYQNVAGGGLDYDTVILTGGGAGVLYTDLAPALNHPRVILADKDPEAIHLANVRGGMKLWRLLEALGILDNDK